jgi:transposase InsO family protein
MNKTFGITKARAQRGSVDRQPAPANWPEEANLEDYQTVPEAVSNLQAYFRFYNQERLHQALEYQTPARVYTNT